MRRPGIPTALALSMLAVGVLGAVSAPVATAEPGPRPTRAQVEAVDQAVAGTADTVAAVRAALVLADQRAQVAARDAAVAAESFNGARLRAEQAAAEAAAADAAATTAQDAVEGHRRAYADVVTRGYAMSPSLSALSAIVRADGITSVIESTASLRNAEAALDTAWDDYRAASIVADATRTSAQRTLADAERAAADSSAARDAAQAAATAASGQVAATVAQRDALIARLATLQQVSVDLARARQSTLETSAAKAATEAAMQAALAAGQAPPATWPLVDLSAVPAPVPGSAPAVSAPGAAAAIAFATAQLGEPYVWGAAGPDAWDCSGLMMLAWSAGGKYLPHYSVAQYAASTPISPVDLQPGDLIFWGRTPSPSSIYHVALYVGGGQMIEAPRTGVPVRLVSMYAWSTPSFYARP